MKLKAKKSFLRKQNSRYTEGFEEVPRSEWPVAIPQNLSREPLHIGWFRSSGAEVERTGGLQ